jgi:hypothetical protein
VFAQILFNAAAVMQSNELNEIATSSRKKPQNPMYIFTFPTSISLNVEWEQANSLGIRGVHFNSLCVEQEVNGVYIPILLDVVVKGVCSWYNQAVHEYLERLEVSC